MPKIVGIDLGTTNSVIAVMEGGEPAVIPTAEGSRLCPSVVGFSKNGERLVGQIAKRQAVTNPDRTVTSIKRRIGSSYKIKVDGREYTPPEISAMILQKLKTDAEAFLGEPITKAVITVPAYFSDSQRQATKDAGTIAGLEVVRIINEPTAAALAYGMDKEDVHTVLVWDLGGGTFDVSILEVGEGVFEVRATNGDTQLGGDDWDEKIVNWLADGFALSNGIDLRKDKMALQRLREAAEKAKVELSNVVSTTINLPFISVTPDGPVHLDVELTRAKLEDLTRDLLQRMVAPTRQALADAGLEAGKIDRVLLVGGSTRMPAVQELVRSIFGKEPFKGLNPDEVVAVGAAIQGAVLSGEVKDIVLLDVTPLSLGIETRGGIFTRLIERNTTIPTEKSQEFTTAVDNQSDVEIKIYQGERELAENNKFLGNFQLSGIQAAPKGVPRIEVTFSVDVNGIVNVSAKDKVTGKAQSITITGSTGLKKDEIERMVHEAEQHASEDGRIRDEREARNFADSAIYGAEKAIFDLNGKVPEATVENVRAKIASLRGALAGTDIEAIKRGSDELGELTSSIARLAAEINEEEEPTATQTEETENVEPESGKNGHRPDTETDAG